MACFVFSPNVLELNFNFFQIFIRMVDRLFSLPKDY
jgi:hypothetical protein